MWRTFAILSALLGMATLVSAQDAQNAPKPGVTTSYYSIPLEAAHQANPMKPTAESLARGKKQYGYDCAMCHGKTGDGKGDVATDMKLKMHDQTDPATLKDRTDGELYYIIVHGKDAMPPGEGDRVKAEVIWDMVNYIRSFSKNAAAEKPAPEKPLEEKTPN
jgi:mono/diheme cytochrome c family protein